MIKKQKQLIWIGFSIGMVLLVGLVFFSLQDQSIESAFIFQYSLPKTILLLAQFVILVLFVGLHSLVLKERSIVRKWIKNKPLKNELFFKIGLGIFLFLALFAGIEMIGADLRIWGMFSKLFYLFFSMMILGIDLLFVMLVFADVSELFVWHQKQFGWVIGISFGILLIFVFGARVFGFLTTQEVYLWNETGNPLLFFQVVIALVSAILLRWVFERVKVAGWVKEVVYSIVIIGVACLVWNWQLDLNSRFYLHPSEPNWEFYPNWDAQTFDFRSEYLRYGFGYTGTKEVMPFLLNIYRLFVGNDYGNFFAVQMSLMLLLPTGIFYLGKHLGNDVFGFVVALLVIFQQKNGIVFSNLMPNINLHALMSEVPMLLFLVWASVFLVLSLKNPSKVYYGLISSTLFFLASLTRLNALIVIGMVVLVLGIYFVAQKRNELKQYIWFIANYVILFASWQFYRFIYSGDVIFYSKIQSVIFRFLGFHKEITAINETAVTETTSTVADGVGSAGILFSSINHLLNSIVRSFLVLPSKMVLFWQADKTFLDLDFWSSDWNFNNLSLRLWIILIINIVLVVGGVVFLWKKKGWISLVPLMVFGGYVLSLGAAQTSGGRYIYPIDWVMIFYYGAGLYSFIQLLLPSLMKQKENSIKAGKKSISFEKPIYFGLLTLIVLMALFPEFHIKKIQYYNHEDQLKKEFVSAYRQYGFDETLIDDWLSESENHFIFSGVALYPYIYGKDLYYFDTQTYVSDVLYSKILNRDINNIYIPLKNNQIPVLPHETDIIALGIKRNKIIIYEYIFYDGQQWYLYQSDIENIDEILNAEF